MKQLGGKLGTSLQVDLCVNTVGDLLQFSEEKLQERYGINTGTWLWNVARGICGDEVNGRLLPQSHGSGKTFPGAQALKTVYSVQKWLNELCEELCERLLRDLEQNKRIARTLTLHASAYKPNDSESLKKFPSKSCPLRNGIAKMQEDALNLFHAGLCEYLGVYHARMKESKQHEWAITGLSVSASKIVVIPSGTHSIMKYFHNQNQTCTTTRESNDICTQGAASLSSSGTGSCTGLHLAEPLNDAHEDETKVDHAMSGSEPDGDEIEADDLYMTKVAGNQDLPFSRTEQKLRLTDETPISCSASENGLGSNLTQSTMDNLQPGLKPEKQKRKFQKDKGSSSILRFFHSDDSCSLPEHAHIKTFGESGSSSSGKLLPENEQPTDGNTMNTCNLREDPSNDDAWSYKKDEIDPSVLNELPLEIQAEVRAWIRPQKRANIGKRGSSIIHYFSPTANS